MRSAPNKVGGSGLCNQPVGSASTRLVVGSIANAHREYQERPLRPGRQLWVRNANHQDVQHRRFTGRFEFHRLDHVSLGHGELAPFRLEPGHIVVNRANSAELVANSALVTAREAGAVIESKNIRLRVKRAVAHPPYVCAALNNEFTRCQIFDGRKQIIGMATIDRETLHNIGLAVPPLDEQVTMMKRLHAR